VTIVIESSSPGLPKGGNDGIGSWHVAGLDVHKKTVVVVVLQSDHSDEDLLRAYLVRRDMA
jgi:hypothetical protein